MERATPASVERTQTASVVPEPQEEPENGAVPPAAAAFVTRGLERATSSVGATPPLPVLDSCHVDKDLSCFPLAVMHMTASQLSPLPEILESV